MPRQWAYVVSVALSVLIHRQILFFFFHVGYTYMFIESDTDNKLLSSKRCYKGKTPLVLALDTVLRVSKGAYILIRNFQISESLSST